MQLSDLAPFVPLLVALLNIVASSVRDYFTSRLNKRSWDEVAGAIHVFEHWEDADDYLLFNFRSHINRLIEERIEIKKPVSPIVVSAISTVLELCFICNAILRKETIVLVSAIASLIVIIFMLLRIIKAYRHFDKQKEERHEKYRARQAELADDLAMALSNLGGIEEMVSDREKQADIENRLVRTLADSDMQSQAYVNQVLRLAKSRQRENKDAD